MTAYFNEAHLQIACSRYFNARKNIIVPNVSWGMNLHECDLLVLTPVGRAYEIEAKTSRADLLADSKKRHGHHNKKICKLYFCVPSGLQDFALANIPERAGLMVVRKPDWLWAEKIREARAVNDYRFTFDERLKLAHLGAMRIWPLLEAINRNDDILL